MDNRHDESQPSPLAKAGPPNNAMAEAESQRAIQEVQAAMVIAKRFPRDEVAARDRIIRSCTRPALAEVSQYSYTRGGTEVTGPSIRLAEALAQNWGNMQFGIRELSTANGESTVEAFAWDMETNTRQVKVFQVPHVRYTRNDGIKKLTDPRDIYEMVANQGARRLRACILGVIPGDIVDEAVRQCDVTSVEKGGAPEDQIKKLVEAFKDMGVTAEMIQQKLAHKLDAVNIAEVNRLKKVYRAIRDGFTTAAAEFPEKAQRPGQAAAAAAASPPPPPAAADTPMRQSLIKTLEEAAGKGSLALDEAWGQTTMSERKLLGDTEWKRLKGVAEGVDYAGPVGEKE